MRMEYWSNSKLADFIRGTVSPRKGTFADWAQWEATAKTAAPYRYWIAETLLDKLQDIVYWPSDQYHAIKYYINNRWVTRTHQLTSARKEIRPGTWCDLGSRFLPCMFNELVNFVEIELASTSYLIAEPFNPPWYAFGPLKMRYWRCADAGIAYLNWSMSLKKDAEWGFSPPHPEYNQPTPQAVAAKEVYDLYMWWTTIYSNRIDPMDESGYSNFFDYEREKYGTSFPSDMSSDDKAMQTKISNHYHTLEEAYKAEEEEMMIRLIKVRDSLWT